jgi:cell wall assembly regulator SMI1
VQKFTRPLTREIELASGRLALTLSEQGIAVRPVGSRRPPWEMSWAAFLCYLTGHAPKDGRQPTPEETAAAVEQLRKGGEAKPAPAAEKTTTAPARAKEQVPDPGAPLLARLDRWLGEHRPHFQEGLYPGASPADLDAFQTRLGMSLPRELRSLLAWHSGQSTEFRGHFEGNFDLMSIHEILAAKQELDAGDRTQTGWQTGWIPFLQDDQGDYVCVDTVQAGAPVREFCQGRADHPVVAPSLPAWLEKFATAIEQGRYHEDAERGTFSQSQA